MERPLGRGADARRKKQVDAVVIGAGFFGCRVALQLHELGMQRVVLCDPEAGLLRRASYANQARVHNGYHYPRSLPTATRSRSNFVRFCSDYPFAVVDSFEKIYAIARQSYVSAARFAALCSEIGIPCRESSRHLHQLFNQELIEAAFLTREVAFDATALARDLLPRLQSAGIDLRLRAAAQIERIADRGSQVRVGDETLQADWILNCSYAALDMVGVALRQQLKRELAEIALIAPPPALANLGITVMDGPFFSTMPFPARACHSLTHVRYTPHAAWTDPADAPNSTRSHAEAMLRDGSRYLPALGDAALLRSLYEVKTVLLKAEDDDARPILFETAAQSERVISVLGGKIDNIYDILEVLRRHDWS
ncbi:MAG TPA: FAD-dependent oxidoreductase [Acetobacteraceae bacterium]|nr:FAD-dependent oxidoreductase [Acetobacteraceae bacterium]